MYNSKQNNGIQQLLDEGEDYKKQIKTLQDRLNTEYRKKSEGVKALIQKKNKTDSQCKLLKKKAEATEKQINNHKMKIDDLKIEFEKIKSEIDKV